LETALPVYFDLLMDIRPLPTTSSGFKNWAEGQNPEE
jgi:hypothetical protein